MARTPLGYPTRTVADKIAFTGDLGAGVVIQVSGAEVSDKWRFRYYRPGNVLATDCYMQIVPAGAPGNTSGVTALFTDCGSTPVVRTFPAGCPCSFGFLGGAFKILGTIAVNYPGTWTGIVDYTDPGNVTTPGVVQDAIYLVKTPLVAVLHGFKSDCDGVTTLRVKLIEQLAIESERVQCYGDEGPQNGYAWQDGIQPAAEGLGPWLARFIEDVDPTQSEVDLVAHSLGGLVARYFREVAYNGSLDPAIGSIAMAGTPNEGVNIAKLERFVCPWVVRVVPYVAQTCAGIDIVGHIIGVDLHSRVIDDLKPSSTVLDALNDGFILPVSPIYRAHVGVRNTWFGRFVSGPGDNDCFISHDSTFGPKDDVFGPNSAYLARFYDGVSHTGGLPTGLPSCGSDTLTNNLAVAQSMVVDIKPWLGFPAPPPGGPAVAPLAASTALQPETPTLRLIDGGVLQAQTNAHTLAVPLDRPSATFAALWIGGDAPADLTVEVLRPGGVAVLPSDADVLETIALDGSAASLFLSGEGFAIANPTPGDWVLRVTGTVVGTDGAPYLVGVFPESQVSLSVATTENVVLSGGPQVVTAELNDTGTAITASIAGRLLKVDNTEQIISLVDDGTNGDALAGDKLYSAIVPTISACGTVRFLLSADAVASSEGAVHREQLASFDVNIAGDAIRDPCDADDDGDGLTDDAELNTHGTNPVNIDSDGDLMTDPAELTAGSDPQDPDSDNDTMIDGYEIIHPCLQLLVADGTGDPDNDNVSSAGEFAQGTLPCDDDTDNDGHKDRPRTTHVSPNTSTSFDNCILVANPGDQLNTDAAALLTPGSQSDDTLALSDAIGDACDADDDNDGLLDTVETAGPPCASATAATNPLLQDTDGERAIDGAECAWGSNPNSAASKPTPGLGRGDSSICPETPDHDDDGDRLKNSFESIIGTAQCDADSDDDGILDGSEYLGYGSSALGLETDGDGLKDCVEIGDVNGNNTVNSQDLGLVAQQNGRTDRPVQDVDKNGVVNAADLGTVARVYPPSLGGTCAP